MSLYCSLLSDTNDTVISQHPNLFRIQIVNCLRVSTHLVTIESNYTSGLTLDFIHFEELAIAARMELLANASLLGVNQLTIVWLSPRL